MAKKLEIQCVECGAEIVGKRRKGMCPRCYARQYYHKQREAALQSAPVVAVIIGEQGSASEEQRRQGVLIARNGVVVINRQPDGTYVNLGTGKTADSYEKLLGCQEA